MHLHLSKLWAELEQDCPAPSTVLDVKVIECDAVIEAVASEDLDALSNMIREMYSGTAFIVRNAAPPDLKTVMLDLARFYEDRYPHGFFKMIESCPNFHRTIDEDITMKYSLYAIKHSYYFYNWNIHNQIEELFKNGVYRFWRYVKILAGNQATAFEFNTPKDGQIDRLQIVKYPRGGGELREHVDPRKNQRVVSGLIMSKRGIDYDTGGFYFRDRSDAVLNIEDQLHVGDSVMFYGSISHGVQPIDIDKPLDWSFDTGRWFIGMFVNDSDHVENRVTASDLSKSVNFRGNLGAV